MAEYTKDPVTGERTKWVNPDGSDWTPWYKDKSILILLIFSISCIWYGLS